MIPSSDSAAGQGDLAPSSDILPQMSGLQVNPGYPQGSHGRPNPIVRRDRLSNRSALERFLRVAPSTTLILLLAGVAFALLAVVTRLLGTPFGFSSLPVWIIFAINGGIALGGTVLLVLSNKTGA